MNRVRLRIIFIGDVPILYILVADDVIYIQGKPQNDIQEFLFQLVELMFYEQPHLKVLPMGIHSFIKGIFLFF